MPAVSRAAICFKSVFSIVIISIGIDIIEVRRVRETIERTPRFAERVFTEAERAYCESRGVVAAQHYAARFAAKEAALKALPTDASAPAGLQRLQRGFFCREA